MRRTPPGEAAANRLVRANGNGVDARGERSEPRWRDIQWVDFSSEPDSATNPIAAPLLTTPVPEPMMHEPEPLYVAPELPSSQSRLAGPGSVAILGVLRRALPGCRVPKLAPAQARWSSAAQTKPPIEALARLRSKTANRIDAPAAAADVAVPSRPLDHAVAAPALSSPSVPPPPSYVTERDAAGDPLNNDRPFPASIMIPVWTDSISGEPAPRDSWRVLLATGVTTGVTTVRDVFRAAAGRAMTAVTSIVAARATAQRLLPGRRAARLEKPRRETSVVATRLSVAADWVSIYVGARKNRLRAYGAAAVVVITVALVAYGGGVLLARVVEPSAAPASTNKAITTASKPQAANQVPQPAPVVPAPSTSPPNEPAARAAFYIAHAKTGDPAAQYDLGVLYAQGQGLVQDYASAASWFRAAATQGNVAAEYNLGVLYERGLGVKANPTEAINWYRAAADQNHAGAQFNLALAYANGSGTSQDFAAAARWYSRAAQQGLAAAMVNLAILYEAGNGVERSAVHAFAWYKVAGERGDNGAKARAAELHQQFDDTDSARAEGLAATIGEALDAAAKPAVPPA